MSRAPIAIALDAPDLETLRAWVSQTCEYVTTMKVGLEVFCRDGHAAVVAARETAALPVDIFLDLKLHDIPATVAGAARAVASVQPRFLTVHASGGPAMITAAAEALPDTLITAVTVLTSLDGADLDAIGLAGPPESAVVRLAKMATASGARALVCSPQEVAAVRDAVGAGIVLITPGVRPAGGSTDDQRRIATPEQAIADGADLLVIGRPITAAADVSLAARTIAASLR
jgi:orotidine-5'-phosphate decarboxylase